MQVTAVKKVEETWTPNTSAPQSSLSQVNTIGCAGERLWIFSLEDSKKRQHMANREDQSDCKTVEHELMIDLDVLDMFVHPGLDRNFQR